MKETNDRDNSLDWQSSSLFPYWTLPKNKNLNAKAKELRQSGVLSEVIFWQKFNIKSNLSGFDIDRQVIIDNFIVDFFYC